MGILVVVFQLRKLYYDARLWMLLCVFYTVTRRAWRVPQLRKLYYDAPLLSSDHEFLVDFSIFLIRPTEQAWVLIS
jgi:hypothetical protein